MCNLYFCPAAFYKTPKACQLFNIIKKVSIDSLFDDFTLGRWVSVEKNDRFICTKPAAYIVCWKRIRNNFWANRLKGRCGKRTNKDESGEKNLLHKNLNVKFTLSKYNVFQAFLFSQCETIS